ncbi:MAG: 4-hydroxy-3-methylbut-2-enyl diphosphate reductase, partial [Clostridia bacterium]|nr:4-hydroxy-3-methylbut-2-enyl diphosphate reductase [Clostridia bacterium]
MRTEIAEYAGFCFGVSRAMKLVYETVEKSEKNICMVGPVIHNPDIIEDLKSKGVRVASDVSEVKKEETAIIRAHGITKEEQEKLSEFGIYFVDTTCPFVKKIHKIVSKAEKEQKSVIIIGDPTHPEVIGIKSYNKNSYVFKDHEDFEKWTENNPELSDKPFEMVAQTTLNLEIWKKCCKYAEKVYTNCKINDTICSATEERQKAALKLSKSCDAMI